jgi:hypothetical protein
MHSANFGAPRDKPAVFFRAGLPQSRQIHCRCSAALFAADIRAGVPGPKSPISHIMGVLFQDYDLAPLRRAAVHARNLVRSSVQLAVVPPLLQYAANFRD